MKQKYRHNWPDCYVNVCGAPGPSFMGGGRLSATGKSRRLETIFSGWPDTCDEHMRRVRTDAIHTALNQFARGMWYVKVSTTDTCCLCVSLGFVM